MRPPDVIAEDAINAGAAQKHAELASLVDLVCGYKPRTVVEIGTMRGGTLKAWCECAADDALIVSIDLPGGEWGGGYTEMEIPRLESYACGQQRMVLLRCDSHLDATKTALRRHLRRRKIDFLFIDGDHTYHGVRQDFEMYSPLVARGGLIAFHDVMHHPAVPGCEVDRFWSEIKDRFEHFEFTHDGDERGYGPWGGIGALVWPA